LEVCSDDNGDVRSPQPTGMMSRLRSFHRRRIDIPVDHRATVLDVGSGDKPHWRADVLVDRYVAASHAAQRSGRAQARIDRPLFDADAAALPFADDAFDYVICSHVLEHVTDPGAVIAELTRVARAGYVEVPEASSAKIVDFPSHLWWCRLDEGALVFEAKATPWFDADIHHFLQTSGLERRLGRLLDRHLDHRVIELRWRGDIPHRVVGSPTAELVAAAAAADADHRVVESVAARWVTAAMTLPWRRRSRRQPVWFNQVVLPQWRRVVDEPLTPGLYRLGTDQESNASK
jgi:SAM-dependent methyltransferase